MEINRTNRTWTNPKPFVYTSNDGVTIERDGQGWWVSTFEDGSPTGWNATLESAMLDADALTYDVDNDGMWVVR